MREKRPFTSTLKVILAVALLAAVLIMVLQNQEPVSTRVLLWSIEGPRFIVLALVFLAGVLAGYVLGRSTRIDLGR